MKLVAMGISID